jgi:hypothetical protein
MFENEVMRRKEEVLVSDFHENSLRSELNFVK